MLRRALIGLGLGVAASLVAVAAAHLQFFRQLENQSYDRRVNWAAAPVRSDSPIAIVEINESSVRALEPLVGRWPWPRIVHAGVIDYLAQAGAKVIAYDVLFGEHEGRSAFVLNGQTVRAEDSDRGFVDAVHRAGNVILLTDVTFEGMVSGKAIGDDARRSIPGPAYTPGTGFQERSAVELPFEELAAAAAGVGHNMLVRDPGSDAARRMLPFVESRGVAIPSLGMAAALVFLRADPAAVRLDGRVLRIGERAVPLLADRVEATRAPSRQMLLRLPRPVTSSDGVRTTFPTYSFFDVLLSEDQRASGRAPAVPSEAFAGKIVFVGTTAAGAYDRYVTPFDGGAAGVELHAAIADSVLSGDFMRRASTNADASLTIAAGIAGGLSATLLPVGWAVAAVVLGISGLVAWLTRAVGTGLWMAAVMPVVSAGVALFGGIAWQYFVEGREKRRIRHLFGRYVSKDVIGQLMSNPALAGLGGERREMTVLFSDIRGFTSATERSTPEAVVAQLNEYFGAMVEVLFRHQGTLDKFVGDMVMGLFGAPLADPQHADHAVAAAVEMTARLAQLNEKWRTEGKPPVDIGIGVNTGEMIAGNIGSDAIMSYTVIGDAVNLGARLESLNKDYGTHILISDATRARLTLPFETRPIGEVTVKGRAQAVMVYEVLASAHGTEHQS